MCDTDQVGTRPYVRLSATALLLAPDCYDGKRAPDLQSEKCWLCMVRKQCEDKVEVELR